MWFQNRRMKWRHMESKQRREQERASAAAVAPRPSCISVPTSIACNSRQTQSVVSPSPKSIPSVNNSNLVSSDISKASSIPHLGILISSFQSLLLVK